MSERIWKFQVGHWFEMNFWPKSCLRFCHAYLNEISGVCEKIVPVSESFWSNFKFLRMIDLTAWLWGWNVRVNGMRSLFSFSAVCSADCRRLLDVSVTVYGIFESVLNWFLACEWSMVRRPPELFIPHSSSEHSSRSELITFQAKENLPKFSNSLFFLLLVIKSLVVS